MFVCYFVLDPAHTPVAHTFDPSYQNAYCPLVSLRKSVDSEVLSQVNYVRLHWSATWLFSHENLKDGAHVQLLVFSTL